MNNKNEIKIFFKSLLNIFSKIYKIKKKEIKLNNKYKFYFECFKYNHILKHINLPNIQLNNKYEAVLFEMNIFPHLEFLIRNTILKLGDKWSHTVICGNLNYDFMKELCSNISDNIKIIKINYDNLTIDDYNLFLTSNEFWNLFVGDKILIYKENSFIFKENINDFLNWDFISARFFKMTNNNLNNIVKTDYEGITLRTKKYMINIIDKINIKNTKINDDIKLYMKNNNLNICPEELYFSLNMKKLNIGKIANFETTFNFSEETLYNPNSFSGYNFWLSNPIWNKRIEENMKINEYIPNSNLNDYLINLNKPLNLNLSKIKKNAFDIDFFFYENANNINIKNNKKLSFHFYNYGMTGMIYHPNQLYNLYPKIKILNFMNNIFIYNNNNLYLLNDFINNYLYSQSFDYFNDLTIHNLYNNLSENYSSFLLLVFIGNITTGNNLLEKIIQYKKLEKFNIVFCFNSTSVYEHFRNIIFKNFIYFSIYFTNEYGTDIQPSILTYNHICKNYNFKYITKLHTKTQENEYNELTNFLLSNKLETLKKLLFINKNKCNCINANNYYLSLHNDVFNKKILQKYQKYIDINKFFVKGTIFFTDHETMLKIINFIKNNDYKSFIFNNLYENNSINSDYSPTHYLERLFGVI